MDALSKIDIPINQHKTQNAQPRKHPAVLELLPGGLYNLPKGPPILFEGQPAYLSSQLAMTTLRQDRRVSEQF